MPVLTLKTDHSGKPVVLLYVGISVDRLEILQEQGLTIPVARTVRALVDTGASRTIVEERYLRSLELPPLAEEEVHTASTGAIPSRLKIYAVELSLAEDVTGTLARNLPVFASPDLSGLGVQMLLGRDFLSRVILTYNGPNREFTLEFDEAVDVS
jgi:predicted aspartyl protease